MDNKEILKEFDDLMIKEYGKWKIGRIEARQFLDQALTKVRENTKKECIDALPNKQREYSFDNQEFKECKGFNYCLSQVKELLTNLIK